MITLNKYKEILKLCTGTQNNKDVDGWETLKEFKHTWSNLAFNYKVYKKDNNIVIALAGTNLFSQNDLRNDWAIWNNNDYKHIPSQFGEAERLYNRVKLKYPKARIVFVGYSLGGSIANLLSHRTGKPSYAIAPIGSKHIAEAYPNYFKFNGNNIMTFGRLGDYLFRKHFYEQSGQIYILPNLKKDEKGIYLKIAANHLLHNFKPQEILKAKIYKKEAKPAQIKNSEIFSSFEPIWSKKLLNNSNANQTFNQSHNKNHSDLYVMPPVVNNTPNVVYNCGLGNMNKVPNNSYQSTVIPAAYTPKYNYTNIPQIDFNRNFPKTVMPQMMPITIMQPVNFSSAPSVYNNISLSGNTLNIPLAVTALDLLINILKNNRKY